METKLTPTEGTWELYDPEKHTDIEPFNNEAVVCHDHENKYDEVHPWVIGTFGRYVKKKDEGLSNAKLVIDAGNTFQKCHLLPSQLLQQRDELMEAIMKLKDEAWRNGVSSEYVHEFCKETIQKHQI